MKKVSSIIIKTMLAALCLTFISACQNDAVADDGTNIRDYSNLGADSENGGGGSGGGGGDGWALCKNTGYEIFDFQVWTGADSLVYENKDGYAHFAYTKGAVGWTGGGLVRAGANDDASVPSFNMGGAKKMKFEIRGTIAPKTLVLAIQNRSDVNGSDVIPSKNPITSLGGVTSLSETEWKTVTIDFSNSTADDIINAFCIIIAGDWGGTTTNCWFDIRNLDWLDSEENSVTLTLK